MIDEQMMEYALTYARKAEGHTGDNPAVGCIITYNDKVLSVGHTLAPGEGHAEANAIQRALQTGIPLDECTLYVTLEPCAFDGRSLACASLITQHRLKRVVVGMVDPHPKVNGKGVEMIEQAGIDVRVGVLESAIKDQLYHWILHCQGL